MYPVKTTKKLIEVALPLDKINEAAAREKTIRHGHPSTLHLWWARRPLAAARAVIFAQMVNDPSETVQGDKRRRETKEAIVRERERLFGIIEKLVIWENSNNEAVLNEAREEIRKSWRHTCELNKNHPDAGELFNPEKLPGFHDPFAGGGALPLEAQRLGLESFASDLNPVAVTINKAMIEIPPKFSGRSPVGPVPQKDKKNADWNEVWSGASGLAEDVRRYGTWMRAEAEKRIGHLYPKIEVTAVMVAERPDLKPLLGQKLTVISWLWARTVRSPNPALSHAEVPLVSTFILSSKAGKKAYVEPVVEGDRYQFKVKTGEPPDGAKEGTKLARGANFRCLLSHTPIEPKHIKSEGVAGRMGVRLMAVVAEGVRGRVYLSPSAYQESTAQSAQPTWIPETNLPDDPRNFWTLSYGLTKFGDIFTARQLVALTTFSDLVQEVIEKCRHDALDLGIDDDGLGLDAGGTGATAYAEAVGVYLAFVLDKMADLGNSLCAWEPIAQCPRHLFGKQAIPMVWDFAEGNPLGNSSGSWDIFVDGVFKAFSKEFANVPSWFRGTVFQADAQTQEISSNKVISTDPPYYDNIGYADLSDFFYVWLRRTLRSTYPSLFATLAVPKQDELVATPYRHGGKDEAERFFMHGMSAAMNNVASKAHPAFPTSIYYAFKQSETQNTTGTSSTGWETFLAAVINAGFTLVGTWPMRTENASRMIGQGTNALASSIVLVCRKRDRNANTVSRREFIRELNATLPDALDEMTRGGVNSPVAPVDLSQAVIGPGMAIFSQYTAVLEADGTPMSVKTALQLINRFFAEEDFDHDTQFCLHWFEDLGWATGQFGSADVLARAKGTSPAGLKESGVAESGSGSFRLLRWAEYPRDWSPEDDSRTPIWEALHHMIRALNQEGESAAGALLARMPSRSEPIRALAYRLYTLCERKGWAEEARAYNELVTAWGPIEQASHEAGPKGTQTQFDF